MKFAPLLLLLLAASGEAHSPAVPEWEWPAQPEQVELHLAFNDGVCSGTAIGPHAILTAAHCFEKGTEILGVNAYPAHEVGKRIADNNEHVIFFVNVTFARWAELRAGARMIAGQRVRMIGHPKGVLWSIHREGVVGGDVVFDDCTTFIPGRKQCVVTLFDMNTAKGDSGAAIFDEAGRIVGVNTGWRNFGGDWLMRVALPLQFNARQLEQVQ